MNSFQLNERAIEVRWSKGSCGIRGCAKQECVCALCAQPIGVPDDDPRRSDHDDECCGCAICEDDVPIILFRGKGRDMLQAAFHGKCFEKIVAR